MQLTLCRRVVAFINRHNVKRTVWLLALASYCSYFYYRYTCLSRQYGSARASVWELVFLAAEFVLTVRPNFLRILAILASVPVEQRSRYLQGDDVPFVDIMIPCCGEALGIIMDTVLATCSLDYPQDRYRVFVLDDGNSFELRAAIKNLKKQKSNLFYTAREDRNRKGFKAGNLNHGIHYSTQIGKGGADFIAGLDADVIPTAGWLRVTIPSLLDDPKMGIAGPPQFYYNVPVNDTLVQTSFPHETLYVRIAHGCAISQGSGYVVRRAALSQIGGFPTDTLSEDVCCSMMLVGAGWKTAYVLKRLQFGLVADSYHSLLKQRTRWNLGDLQTGLKFNFFLWGPLSRCLTVPQRLAGLLLPIQAVHSICLPFATTSFVVLMTCGFPLVHYGTVDELSVLTRLAASMVIFEGLQDFLACQIFGVRPYLRFIQVPLWMSPYHFQKFLQNYVLPIRLGGKQVTFKPTGSKDKYDAPPSEETLTSRLIAVLWAGKALYHVLFVAFSLLAVGRTISKVAGGSSPRDQAEKLLWEQILTRLAWPPLLWLGMVIGNLVPIYYAIFGSGAMAREKLMLADPTTGVKRPHGIPSLPTYTRWEVNAEHFRLVAFANAVLVLIVSFVL